MANNIRCSLDSVDTYGNRGSYFTDSLNTMDPEIQAALYQPPPPPPPPPPDPRMLGHKNDEDGPYIDIGDAFSAMRDDEEVPNDDFKPLTEIPIPAWLDMAMSLIGIDEFIYKIQMERERRADDAFQNPYLEVEEVVLSLQFEILVGAIIMLNSILIGWEASVAEGELAGLFNVFEHGFTLFFFGEWCLRVIAFGWVWIFEPVNFADTCLALGTGVLVKWIAEPMGVDLGHFRIITVLRTLRLVRLARAVRLQPTFKELWILIRGLTTSTRPLAWTLVIAFAVLYVFAIAAVEIIGRGAKFVDDEYAQLLFGDFLRAMFTMLQLITMDTYCDTVIRPLMKKEGWLGFFFVFFICVGVFIVMNLVTAIIVENAFNIVKEDKDSVAKEEELKKRRELKLLSELFMEIDLDGSGELSRDEFFGSLQNRKVKILLDTMEMKPAELEDVWEVLDDGDGLLTIKEFTDGLRRMKGAAKAKDVADVIKKLRTTDRKHLELQEQARKYTNTLRQLELDADEMARDAHEVAVLFREMFHRLSRWIDKGEREDKFRRKKEAKLEKLAAGMADEEAETESDGDDDGDDDDDADMLQ